MLYDTRVEAAPSSEDTVTPPRWSIKRRLERVAVLLDALPGTTALVVDAGGPGRSVVEPSGHVWTAPIWQGLF